MNIIKDYNKFLKKIKEFKLYIIEFKKDNAVKTKLYLSNYIIKRENCNLIIIIIYDKCIFLINHGNWKT